MIIFDDMIGDEKATNTILEGLYAPISGIMDCTAWASWCSDGMDEWRMTIRNDTVNWYEYRNDDCAENRMKCRNDCFRKGTPGLLIKTDEGYAADIPDTTEDISMVRFITSNDNGIDSDFSANICAQNCN